MATSTSPAAVANGNDTKVATLESPEKAQSRSRKPNYKHIHRFPLPIEVHPLPPLIPHNPLSLISIVFSYLTYLIAPPHRETYNAYFDLATSSVHVTDPRDSRMLWEMGFFGKGSLSRSEPSWLDRTKRSKGFVTNATSEEITGKRRSERRERKLERARQEREAIAEQLRAEKRTQEAAAVMNKYSKEPTDEKSTSGVNVHDEPTAETKLNGINSSSLTRHATPPSLNKPNEKPSNTPNSVKTVRFSSIVETKEYALPHQPDFSTEEADVANVENEEHLQLSHEEALFLAYGLGVLNVHDNEGKGIIDTSSLLSIFRRCSYFPPRDDTSRLEPDDPFIVSYIVYHHFRSLGWVPRSGVKFGVDYLLYNRGPVFSHAEFAVVVLPTYSDHYWSETAERREIVGQKQNRSWWWLHCVNRVQAQVKKSLVLCYVDIPPCESMENDPVDLGALLKMYKVRELNIRRWVPNRTRD